MEDKNLPPFKKQKSDEAPPSTGDKSSVDELRRKSEPTVPTQSSLVTQTLQDPTNPSRSLSSSESFAVQTNPTESGAWTTGAQIDSQESKGLDISVSTGLERSISCASVSSQKTTCSEEIPLDMTDSLRNKQMLEVAKEKTDKGRCALSVPSTPHRRPKLVDSSQLEKRAASPDILLDPDEEEQHQKPSTSEKDEENLDESEGKKKATE